MRALEHEIVSLAAKAATDVATKAKLDAKQTELMALTAELLQSQQS